MDVLLAAVPVLLIGTGIFYMFKLKGFYLLHPLRTLAPLFKKTSGGGISPMKALLLALAGTLGVGNIVGVATALSLGGPGAVFWMLLSAMVAMVLKYAEIVLAIRHRRCQADGSFVGGAPYYIKDGFSNMGLHKAGKVVAGIFAILCLCNTFTIGSMLQSNAVAGSLDEAFNCPTWLTGGLIALLCIPVIKGGAKQISRLTEGIVPLMTVGFLVLCLAVIALRWERVPQALTQICTDAFSFRSAGGGFLGFLASRSLKYGVMRGLVSNEAGCGTAPMAHATAQQNSPAEQGVFGFVEVFVDTILLCTITALAILVSDSGYLAFPDDGVRTAQAAFASVLGAWASIFFAIAVVFFGVATILCWAHYGNTSVDALVKNKPRLHGLAKTLFPLAYAASVFAGAVATPTGVWTLADMALALMTIINLFVLLMMNREVREETKIFVEGWKKK